MGLKKTGIEALEKLPSKPLTVVACEDSNWLVFHVEVKSEEGLKILRLRGDSVRDRASSAIKEIERRVIAAA